MDTPYCPAAGLADEINRLKTSAKPLAWADSYHARSRANHARLALRRIRKELQRKAGGADDSPLLVPRLLRIVLERNHALSQIRLGFKRVERARTAAWQAQPLLHAPARPAADVIGVCVDRTDPPAQPLFP